MGNYFTNYFVREVEADSEKQKLQEQVKELRQENKKLANELKLKPSKSYFVRDKSYLNSMLEASKAVCYIRLADGKAGTGFLVGNDVVLTALHVISPDNGNDASKISNMLKDADFTFSFFRDARTPSPETTFRALRDEKDRAIVYFPGKRRSDSTKSTTQPPEKDPKPSKTPNIRYHVDFILVRLKSQPEAEGAESALDGKTFIPLPMKRYTNFGPIPDKNYPDERRKAINNLATAVRKNEPPVTTLYHLNNQPLCIFQSRITDTMVENFFLECICFTYGPRGKEDNLSFPGASGSPLLAGGDDNNPETSWGLIGMHVKGTDKYSKAIYVNGIIEQLLFDRKKQKLPLVKQLLDDVLSTQEDRFVADFKPKDLETVTLSLQNKLKFEESCHRAKVFDSNCEARHIYDAEATSWITQVVELIPSQSVSTQLPYKATVSLSHSFSGEESSPIALLWNEDQIISTESPLTFQILGQFVRGREKPEVHKDIVKSASIDYDKGTIEVAIVFSGNICRLAAKCDSQLFTFDLRRSVITASSNLWRLDAWLSPTHKKSDKEPDRRYPQSFFLTRNDQFDVQYENCTLEKKTFKPTNQIQCLSFTKEHIDNTKGEITIYINKKEKNRFVIYM